ncbi:MAG: RNA methyltransferase [Rhodospirillales bacterium]|nr:RNA methyltransferase [Rhodospirillales bacterium]MBO6787833.1 RNA methyltransferase [Rhodospirillales bacterium]
MRGFFGIGVEGVSKEMNVGNLFRSAHAFDASFVFTVRAAYTRRGGGRSDTSDSLAHLPFYEFPDIDAMLLPAGCKLVGVELIDDSIDLPSFHHPPQAAYILGPERGELSPEMLSRCDHVIKIPTKFCVNVGIAGALVMYDRVLSMGRFAPRPVRPGGPIEELKPQRHGGPKFRKEAEAYRAPAPRAYND